MQHENTVLQALLAERERTVNELTRIDQAIQLFKDDKENGGQPRRARPETTGEAIDRFLKVKGKGMRLVELSRATGRPYQSVVGALRHGQKRGRYRKEGKLWFRVA